MNKNYIGVKMVMAEPITLDDFIKTYGRNPYANRSNIDESLKTGYAVHYDDSYTGYAPKEVFEKAYRPVDALNYTCIGMISSDYKEKFKAEYFALITRFNRLKQMVDKWDAGTLDFTPTCPREIYDDQLQFMLGYINILKKRAEIEEVDITVTTVS